MENYPELTSYFASLLDNHRSIELAEAEFRRVMADDEEIRDQYKEWCAENGYSLRHGFSEYAEEYMETRASIWDALNNYDEDE